MKKICVFCGSSQGTNPKFTDEAKLLGQTLAQQGIGLVYGGASCGIMGTVADAVMQSGGDVIGVIPKSLFAREVVHDGLKDLRVVNSMHERKALMAELSDGFIALPGGYGTLEEFCEILTWAQLGLHQKPIGLLNVDGYYDSLLAFFDRAVTDGFVKEKYLGLFVHAENVDGIFRLMKAYRPVEVQRWVTDSSET